MQANNLQESKTQQQNLQRLTGAEIKRVSGGGASSGSGNGGSSATSVNNQAAAIAAALAKVLKR